MGHTGTESHGSSNSYSWPDNDVTTGISVSFSQANPPQVRRGWSAFKCECGRVWAEPTRDHMVNIYGVMCPDCDQTFCHPIRSWPDPELKVDEHGNLVNGGL